MSLVMANPPTRNLASETPSICHCGVSRDRNLWCQNDNHPTGLFVPMDATNVLYHDLPRPETPSPLVCEPLSIIEWRFPPLAPLLS